MVDAMPVRVGLILSGVCVAALLVSAATASTGAAGNASAKIKAPATGHFSITPISVTTKSGKKPKLHLVGTVARNVVVAAGLTADPKKKGRFIGAVVLVNRKTSTTKARNIQTAAATFVVVNAPDSDVVVVPSLREAICQAKAGDTIIVGSSFLANPPGPGITPFMNAGFASFCDDGFGSFDGRSDGNTFLSNIVDPTSNTIRPNPFSCTLRTQPDPGFPTNEWNIFASCTQPVTGAIFTFPAGTSISAFLPASGSANGNILTFTGLNMPGGSPTEFDARFNGAFTPRAPFSASFTGPGGTANISGIGP